MRFTQFWNGLNIPEDMHICLLLNGCYLSLSWHEGPRSVGGGTQDMAAQLATMAYHKWCAMAWHCNMLVHSLQGRGVWEPAGVRKEFYFLDGCSAVTVTEIPFTGRDATSKTMDPKADKTWSDHFGWYIFLWVGVRCDGLVKTRVLETIQERSMFLCNGDQRCQDDCHTDRPWEVWRSLESWWVILINLSRCMSRDLLDASVEVKKRGYI